MEPNRMDYIIHLSFLVIGIVFYAYILINAGIRKKGNVNNEIIVGSLVFMLILVRVIVGLDLLRANGVTYLALGMELLATIGILLIKPDSKKMNVSPWHQSLKISSMVMGLVSIIGLLIVGLTVYYVFGPMMPSSASVILLGIIPFLIAMIYKFIQLHEQNKTLK